MRWLYEVAILCLWATTIPVLIYYSPRGKFGRVFCNLIIHSTIFSIYLLLDNWNQTLIVAGLYFAAVVWEGLATRNQYEIGSSESVRSAILVIMKQVTIIVGVQIGQILFAGIYPTWGLNSQGVPVWMQAAIGFFVYDFYHYCMHRWGQHGCDFYWRVHRIHHSTQEMTSTAWGRTHWIEYAVDQVLLPILLLNLALGLSGQAFYYANLPFFLIGAFTNHANVDFPRGKFPWWGKIVMTPNAHALHHELDGNQNNFGSCLMIWDFLFGTLRVPTGEQKIFGLTDVEFINSNVLQQQINSLINTQRPSASEAGVIQPLKPDVRC